MIQVYEDIKEKQKYNILGNPEMIRLLPLPPPPKLYYV